MRAVGHLDPEVGENIDLGKFYLDSIASDSLPRAKCSSQKSSFQTLCPGYRPNKEVWDRTTPALHEYWASCFGRADNRPG